MLLTDKHFVLVIFMYFYLSFNTIHLSQNSCIATQIVDMKMNIFLGRELITLIVSPFSNLCLKTVLGFINNGDKCRFNSSTALKILQDGMLFNIMVVLVAYFLGCQLDYVTTHRHLGLIFLIIKVNNAYKNLRLLKTLKFTLGRTKFLNIHQ